MQNIIEAVRKERHINQETMARAVGVSRQTIISIERGKCVPSVALALRIARFLGMTVEELFVGDGACFWNLSPEPNANYLKNISVPFDSSFIYGQGQMSGFVYGNFPLSFNGGEIIAVYNALRLCGNEATLADLILEFEANGMAMLGGFAGTDPKKLGLYFSAHSIEWQTFATDGEAETWFASSEKTVFVYSYFDLKCPTEFKGLHTVTGVWENGLLRVYNISDNDRNAVEFDSFAQFKKGKRTIIAYKVGK